MRQAIWRGSIEERSSSSIKMMWNYVVKEPMVIGHECAGIVEEVGNEVKHLVYGDRVALEPGISCWKCSPCKDGRYNLCPDMKFFATPPIHGSLADQDGAEGGAAVDRRGVAGADGGAAIAIHAATETTTVGRMAERGGADAVAVACCEPAALTEAEVLMVAMLTKGEAWRRSRCKSWQIAAGGRWRWNDAATWLP
ncbi:hypothetical protein OROMI_034049 [Orobanche minor]